MRDETVLSWFVKAIQRPRDHPFSRRLQLTGVFLGHLVLAALVGGVYLLAYDWAPPPTGFLLAEGLILLGCALVLILDPARELAGRYVPPAERDPDATLAPLEQVAQFVLLGAFVAQLVAVVPLLDETGGPINSPFAQLTVVFAIFTPYLANNGLTMLISLAVTIVFYIVCAWWFGGLAEVSGHSAPVWAYVAVNAVILALTIFVTLFDSISRDLLSAAARVHESVRDDDEPEPPGNDTDDHPGPSGPPRGPSLPSAHPPRVVEGGSEA